MLVLAARAVPGGLLLAGCGAFGRQAPRPSPRPSASSAQRPDPLLPLLAAERGLLSSYDAVLARYPQLLPRLAAVRADHAAHLDALRTLTGQHHQLPLPATTAPATASAAVAALRLAEEAAAARTGAACLAAPSSQAALLGSIAACESAHRLLLH